MRKLLLSLTVIAAATAAAGTASAAPTPGNIHLQADQPQLQTVQYREGWRHDEWRRREAHRRWIRHEAWRRHHEGRHF